MDAVREDRKVERGEDVEDGGGGMGRTILMGTAPEHGANPASKRAPC